MGCLMWAYQILCIQLLFLCSQSSATLCSHEQSSALLHFKQHFSFINCFSFDFDVYSPCLCSYPKMMSWKEDKDCCLWDGVTCDSLTGHVISLDLSCAWFYGSFPSNSSLFLLNHLQRLNLAYNDFNLSHVSFDFHRLSSLTYLNLSYSNFSGQIPSEIAHLSKLTMLDVSQNDFDKLSIETNALKGLVQNLTELAELRLDNVNMSTVLPNSLMNLSSSLSSLSLSDCTLQGIFPNIIFDLPSLKTLNLASNYNLTVAFPKVNWSSPLKFLDVSFTVFSGELPTSLGSLKYLTHFDASYCGLTGLVPIPLGNLSNLTYLSLAGNNFGGQIPSFFSNFVQLNILDLSENNFVHQIPSFFSNFVQLNRLDLSRNNFVGQIPDGFFNLTQLSYLDFSLNQLTGPIPSHVNGFGTLFHISLYFNSFSGSLPFWLFTLPSLWFVDFGFNQLTGTINEFHSKSLETLCLDSNRLHGSVPSSIFELVNLTTLYLSLDNSSDIDLYQFSKLKKLEMLDLSHVNLSLSTPLKGNSSFPQLTLLRLSACNLSEFPDILRETDQLTWLDLSENKIRGRIPKLMWDIGKESLTYLNLSHNFLTTIDQLPWKNLKYLDLRFNFIQAPFPIPQPSLIFLSLSNNNLTGEMPQLCNLSVVYVLDLSNNNLNGTILECMVNSSSLQVLDIRNNRLHGNIPNSFARGNQLRTLNFDGNGLEGLVPRSLVNCAGLEVLDLGNNKITDSFPYWLRDLPKLQVLVLRFNNFYGSDWGSFKLNGSFPKLRILDLSNNNFNGNLPIKFFENLKAMINLDEAKKKLNYMGDALYQDSVVVVVKGLKTQREKIPTTFTTIDFSNNSFHGEIPNTIGKLHSLRLLNLSQNSLTGHIPLSLGDLTALEALDLSSNKLDGAIPTQLVSLTFLAKLNLSHNQLVGPIPQENQFETFGSDSYIGNPGLCGFVLPKKCNIDDAAEPKSSIFHGKKLSITGWCEWKVVMMGYGCGLPLGLFIGYQVFRTGKPQWLLRVINRATKRCVRRRRRNR